MLVSQINGVGSSLPIEGHLTMTVFLTMQADGSHEDAEDMETGEGLTFEDVQQEAAAKQRAFESQQAKTSTSGNGGEKGKSFPIFASDGSRRFSEFHSLLRAAENSTVSVKTSLLGLLFPPCPPYDPAL